MTQTRILSVLLFSAALAVAAAPASASLVGATVDITAGNGFSSGSSICKSAAVSGVSVGAGLELNGSDWKLACGGYYGADISGDQIVLTSLQSGNYSYATLNIHIASGPNITGVTFGGYTNNFFSSLYPKNDSNFLPTITFDSDDIFITWDTFTNSSQFAFSANPGMASFRVTTADATVPEPGTLALLAAGLLSVAGLRRRAS